MQEKFEKLLKNLDEMFENYNKGHLVGPQDIIGLGYDIETQLPEEAGSVATNNFIVVQTMELHSDNLVLINQNNCIIAGLQALNENIIKLLEK